MIDTAPYQQCECRRRASGKLHSLCDSELSLEENGKKVTLNLHSGEEAKAVVLDGCVFADSEMRCDAVYLFKGNNRKVAALVELKGASGIAHAFEQLAYTKNRRKEYQELKEKLDEAGPGRLREMAFIVTNGMLSKPER